MYVSRNDRICLVSLLKVSSGAAKVMNSVFGALMDVQLLRRMANEPVATLLKVFGQRTGGVAMSTI